MDRKVFFGILAVSIIGILIGGYFAGSFLFRAKQDNGSDLGDFSEWTGEGLDERNATSEGLSKISASLNQFGIDIYLELLNDGSDNVFISPYSIFTALSMTYEGARGNTASQMADVLYLPDNDTIRRGSFAMVQNMIENGTNDYELSSPNKIWPQEGYPFLQSFYDIIENFYYGGIEELDFVSDPEGARQTINQWVENQTKDRIKDLLPRGTIDNATVMVLTNAIYFLGTWIYEFNKEDTMDMNFYPSSGDSIKAPMMSMKVKEGLNYYKDDELEALELPYKGDDLSMVILLPKDGITSIEASLSEDMLSRVMEGMEGTEVDVFLPKFELETEYPLKEPLMELGMVDAFGPADFNGMGPGPLFISAVQHKAFVKVNEEGTEATAATAVVVPRGPRIPVFRADHPFMFFIMHKETNSILFMGKVEDPLR